MLTQGLVFRGEKSEPRGSGKSLALSGAGRNSLRHKANPDRAENRFSLVVMMTAWHGFLSPQVDCDRFICAFSGSLSNSWNAGWWVRGICGAFS